MWLCPGPLSNICSTSFAFIIVARSDFLHLYSDLPWFQVCQTKELSIILATKTKKAPSLLNNWFTQMNFYFSLYHSIMTSHPNLKPISSRATNSHCTVRLRVLQCCFWLREITAILCRETLAKFSNHYLSDISPLVTLGESGGDSLHHWLIIIA